MISPHASRQQFSMLETASVASASDVDDAALLPYRSSSAGRPSSSSPVHLADSIGPMKFQQQQHVHPLHHSPLSLLLARDNLGLLVHYAAVGVVHGLLQALSYPFLNVFLNVSDYLAYASERWMAVPWLLKVFAALASDCSPVRGSRRRVYMLAGWAWALLFSLVLAAKPVGTAYLTTDEYGNNVINYDAPSAGRTYAALFTMVAFGFVFADVAADGATLELARRFQQQPQWGSATPTPAFTADESGNAARVIMATVYGVRFSAQFVTMFLAAFLCSSSEYGGTFAWGAPLNGMMVLALLACVAALAATWFCVSEETPIVPQAERSSEESPRILGSVLAKLSDCRRLVWRLARRRSVLRACTYAFVSRVCFTYYASTEKAVYEDWAPAALLTTSVFASLHAAVFAAASIAVALLLLRPTAEGGGKLADFVYGDSSKWFGRRLAFMAVVASAFVSLIVALFAIFNVLRYAAVLLLLEQIGAFFDALAFLVVLFVATGVVEPGLESTSFNLVASLAGNLAVPFAITLSQSVGEHFDVYDSEYAADSTHARSQVMLCVVVAIVVRLLNLAALPLLPSTREPRAVAKGERDQEKTVEGTGTLVVETPTSGRKLGVDLFGGVIESKASDEGRCSDGSETSNPELVGKWPALAALGVAGFLLLWAVLMVLLASVERTSCLTVAGGESC
jgi:hypothetical protein